MDNNICLHNSPALSRLEEPLTRAAAATVYVAATTAVAVIAVDTAVATALPLMFLCWLPLLLTLPISAVCAAFILILTP